LFCLPPPDNDCHFNPWSRVLLDNLSYSASQEIPRLLWSAKVYYRVHKIPPLVPMLIQINLFRNLPPHVPKVHSNIILPSMLRSSECSLPFSFSYQTPNVT
jgi:hypothetical protein